MGACSAALNNVDKQLPYTTRSPIGLSSSQLRPIVLQLLSVTPVCGGGVVSVVCVKIISAVMQKCRQLSHLGDLIRYICRVTSNHCAIWLASSPGSPLRARAIIASDDL